MSCRGSIRPFQQQSVSSVSGENIKLRRLISSVWSTKAKVVCVHPQSHKQHIHDFNCQKSLMFCKTFKHIFYAWKLLWKSFIQYCTVSFSWSFTPESLLLLSAEQLHQSSFTFPVQYIHSVNHRAASPSCKCSKRLQSLSTSSKHNTCMDCTCIKPNS